uniref:DMP19 family protein n=1 Tax=Cohnella caldifontis TaxID=3027471 RepID=UPI003BB6AE96
MNNIRLIVQNLLPNNEFLFSLSASEIVEHICVGVYEEETHVLRDKVILSSIPQLIRDCVLLIDFDTEINMNGIFGYLENSTGYFIEETIEVLERIGAVSDAIALNNIKRILV